MTKGISAADLREFSGEHLFYEIKMLFDVNDLLQKKGVEQGCVYNALLESFIIHAAIILDFFYKPPMKEDDATAVHFIRDVGRWKALRPPFDSYYRKFYRRRSREVVHLSYQRLQIKAEEKPWNIRKVTEQIRRIVDVFLETADPQRLHPNMYELRTQKK